ncbi:hypothetical protein GQR58_002826 [Nymphon striatum]|nr:hypothetical protein GQR58_002826 [Nymphon striatum]
MTLYWTVLSLINFQQLPPRCYKSPHVETLDAVIALQYYAAGTFQMVVGDPIQVSQSTSCRVSRAQAGKIHIYVKLPEQVDAKIMSAFLPKFTKSHYDILEYTIHYLNKFCVSQRFRGTMFSTRVKTSADQLKRTAVIALQYYAAGTFQMVVGDPIQVSQSTSCRVSRAQAGKIHIYVKLPEQLDTGVMNCFSYVKVMKILWRLLVGLDKDTFFQHASDVCGHISMKIPQAQWPVSRASLICSVILNTARDVEFHCFHLLTLEMEMSRHEIIRKFFLCAKSDLTYISEEIIVWFGWLRWNRIPVDHFEQFTG